MNLREFLEESGMKQIVLASRAKVPQGTITKLLYGADIKLSTAMRICKASKNKITPQDLYQTLMGDDEDQNRKKTEKKTKKSIKK